MFNCGLSFDVAGLLPLSMAPIQWDGPKRIGRRSFSIRVVFVGEILFWKAGLSIFVSICGGVLTMCLIGWAIGCI
jgi:hypothetical protein